MEVSDRDRAIADRLEHAGLEVDEIASAMSKWDSSVPLTSELRSLLTVFKDGGVSRLVVLGGLPGCGKTKIAALAARLWVSARLGRGEGGLMWCHEGTAWHDIQAERNKSNGATTFPERAIAASLLIVDDFGCIGDRATSLMESVILTRHRKGAPTLITTNDQGLSNRLQSRLSAGVAVWMEYPDYRSSKRKKVK